MNQPSLFNTVGEKGSREWRIFDSVVDEKPGMFRVATPIKRQPQYANVVHIRRHKTPHTLFPKPAH